MKRSGEWTRENLVGRTLSRFANRACCLVLQLQGPAKRLSNITARANEAVGESNDEISDGAEEKQWVGEKLTFRSMRMLS